MDEDSSLTRSSEVQNLAKSITELSVLFKDLSALVVEQGTVLDRIDSNIMEASVHVEKGNKHLDGALKIEQSGCSRKVIIGLSIGIFVCALILLLRWTR